jgi:hypothetical protein
MTRAARNALAMIAAIAACLALLPATAVAGSYVVSACSPSASAGLWTPVNTFPNSWQTGNLCGGPQIGPVDGANQGGLYAQDILMSPTNMPDGSYAGWTLTAPQGATITAVSYYRTLAAHSDRDMMAGLITAEGTVLEQCTIEIPLGSPIDCYKPNSQAPTMFSGLNTASLFLGVKCRVVVLPSSGGCGAGGTIHHARAVLYSARVTLTESSAPTLADVAGPLWGSGIVSGVVPVTFTATDATGIQEQLVRSDSRATLIAVPQACDFMLAQPCPQQPAGSLSVDTRRVSDGPHTFSLVVTDAAGNSQVVTSPTVVVDNDGPPPPVSFTATPKGGGSNVIALAWRNPTGAPVPITAAQLQLCESSCPAAVTVGSTGAAQITAPGPGLYTVRLWLLDAHGKGGSHNAALATTTIPAAGAGSSSKRTRIKAVLRGRRLRVSGSIARTGRVRVSWRSKVGNRTVGAGSRMVTIRAHTLTATFALSSRARRGTTRIAVRAGTRIVAQARARRA